MKVVCIETKGEIIEPRPGQKSYLSEIMKDNNYVGVTLNKSYDVIDYFYGNKKGYNYPNILWYSIINDFETNKDYPSNIFAKIEELRNNKLSQLEI